jgi:hypothetical protein
MDSHCESSTVRVAQQRWVDKETLENRAVELASRDMGEAPIQPVLLEQLSTDQEIASVTADVVYSMHKSHDPFLERGAATVIPPHKNAKPCRAIKFGAIIGLAHFSK